MSQSDRTEKMFAKIEGILRFWDRHGSFVCVLRKHSAPSRGRPARNLSDGEGADRALPVQAHDRPPVRLSRPDASSDARGKRDQAINPPGVDHRGEATATRNPQYRRRGLGVSRSLIWTGRRPTDADPHRWSVTQPLAGIPAPVPAAGAQAARERPGRRQRARRRHHRRRCRPGPVRAAADGRTGRRTDQLGVPVGSVGGPVPAHDPSGARVGIGTE
jgi:hypothetical protein